MVIQMILQIVPTEPVPRMEQLVPGTAGINTMAASPRTCPGPFVIPPVHNGPAGHDVFSYPGSVFLFASFDDK